MLVPVRPHLAPGSDDPAADPQRRHPDSRPETVVPVRLSPELAACVDRHATTHGVTAGQVIAEWVAERCGASPDGDSWAGVLDRLARLEERVFDPWE